MNNNISRRKFLEFSGLTGAAFIVGISRSTATPGIINMRMAEGSTVELLPFVIIEKSGKITLMNTRPDMGQGTFQSIPALIAEELEVSLDAVTILQTGGEKKYGNEQGAGGSYSVRGSYFTMRKVGASAREMLVKAAAQTWNVPESECFAENAMVKHRPSGKSIGYGDLAETAATLPVPENPTLKDPKDFKILSKPMTRPDLPWKVSGKPIFGIDMEVPGMAYASVERSPVFGAKLVRYDDSEALKVPGVQKVVVGERVFGTKKWPSVAVIADNYWAAQKGRKALKVEWDFQGNDSFNSKDYEQQLRDLSQKDGLEAHNTGNFQTAFDAASMRLEALYETPFVSHSPMEPMNCLAQWTGNKLEIWVSTQDPQWMIGDLAGQFGIPAEDIKINVAFNGGGFGRRLFPDVACETASIAKLAGKPVKVIWTREDDTQQGPFRPLTFSALKAGLSTGGAIAAWQHKVISPSIEATMSENYDDKKSDGTMMESTAEQAYEIPNLNTRFVYAPVPVPLGYWRAVTSTTTAFAHECFMDELAVASHRDPMEYRLAHLTKPSDTKRVLLKLKEVSGWDKPLPKGRGRGVAQWAFFAGLGGNVVEVSTNTDGAVKIEKIYAVIDLGTVVNPDTVRAQVEGAIVMALTAATKGGITFEAGRAAQSNFHNNEMLRFDEMPPVEIHILAEGGETIKGVGEPGLPPVAPALANAIFAATGKRIRRMPFEL